MVKIDLNQAIEDLQAARGLDRDEVVANALIKVGVAYLERGRLDAAAEALEEAHHYCRQLDNDAGRAQVALRLAQVDEGRGQLQAAALRLAEALEVFRGQADLAGQVAALERLSQVLALAGRLSQAAGCLREALDLVEPAGDKVSLVLLNQYLAPLLRRLDQREAALAAYERMGRLAQEIGDLQRLALALVGVGTLQAEGGSLGAGLRNLDQAAQVFSGLGQQTRAAQVRDEIERLRGVGAAAQTESKEREPCKPS